MKLDIKVLSEADVELALEDHVTATFDLMTRPINGPLTHVTAAAHRAAPSRAL